MKNTILSAEKYLSDKDIRPSELRTSEQLGSVLVAYTDTIIQSETAELKAEIASLRSRLDDCKRRAITGHRV